MSATRCCSYCGENTHSVTTCRNPGIEELFNAAIRIFCMTINPFRERDEIYREFVSQMRVFSAKDVKTLCVNARVFGGYPIGSSRDTKARGLELLFEAFNHNPNITFGGGAFGLQGWYIDRTRQIIRDTEDEQIIALALLGGRGPAVPVLETPGPTRVVIPHPFQHIFDRVGIGRQPEPTRGLDGIQLFREDADDRGLSIFDNPTVSSIPDVCVDKSLTSVLDICAVCLDTNICAKSVATLHCNHQCCISCIQKIHTTSVTKNRMKCPLCRNVADTVRVNGDCNEVLFVN